MNMKHKNRKSLTLGKMAGVGFGYAIIMAGLSQPSYGQQVDSPIACTAPALSMIGENPAVACGTPIQDPEDPDSTVETTATVETDGSIAIGGSASVRQYAIDSGGFEGTYTGNVPLEAGSEDRVHMSDVNVIVFSNPDRSIRIFFDGGPRDREEITIDANMEFTLVNRPAPLRTLLGDNSIAIGTGAEVTNEDSVAIGSSARIMRDDRDDGEESFILAVTGTLTGDINGDGIVAEDEMNVRVDIVDIGENGGREVYRSGTNMRVDGDFTLTREGLLVLRRPIRPDEPEVVGHAVAIGADASVIGTGGTAIGADASVTGTDGIAIGRGVTSGANEVHIGSSLAISTGGTAIGAGASITDADGMATDGTAIGEGASVTGTDGIAIGRDVTSGENEIHIGAEGQTSVRIGSSLAISTGGTAIGAGASITDADGMATDGTAIGEGASVTGTDGIAIGRDVTSGENEIHIGREGQTSVRIGSSLAISTGGTAVGAGASITDADGIATYGTAIGEGASVTGTDGIAIGRGATVTGIDGIAIGYGVTSGENEIHIGREGQTSVRIGSSLAISTGGTAVGADALVSDTDGIAIGRGATSGGEGGTAIGAGASVTGTDGIAIGYGVTSGENEIHIGREGQTSVRIGSSLAISTGGTAVGAGASITDADGIATDGTAIGEGASVTGTDGIAIGYGVTSGEDEIHIGRGRVDDIPGQTAVRIGDYSLGTFRTDIADNVVAIETNRDNIARNEGRITTNEGNIARNEGRITTNEGNIARNEGRITTNEGNIASNEGRITTNEGGIASNEGRITTNEGGIASNEGRITTNEGGIASNEGRITTNEGGIASNEGRITINEGGINTNTAGINRNAQGIATNAQGIDNNRAGIATAVALASLPIISGARGGWSIAAGTYDSETAIAVGANFNVRQNATIRFAISTSSGETSGAIGFGMGF